MKREWAENLECLDVFFLLKYVHDYKWSFSDLCVSGPLQDE